MNLKQIAKLDCGNGANCPAAYSDEFKNMHVVGYKLTDDHLNWLHERKIHTPGIYYDDVGEQFILVQPKGGADKRDEMFPSKPEHGLVIPRSLFMLMVSSSKDQLLAELDELSLPGRNSSLIREFLAKS